MPENPPDSKPETAETPEKPASGYYYDDACGYEVYVPDDDEDDTGEDPTDDSATT